MSSGLVRKFAIQLLVSLHFMKENNIIHCDLKPDNIMIGDYVRDAKMMNQIYLIDFGIS